MVASLEAGPATERSRYLAGSALGLGFGRRVDLLARLAASGHRTAAIDPDAAFREARRVELRAGERLIEAGAPSNFVYIPLGEGLGGRPLGGYGGFAVRPWIPVGLTGVIRGAARNAEVFAETDVALLAIPKGAFLEHWHFTYDQKAFAALFDDREPRTIRLECRGDRGRGGGRINDC